MPAFDIDSQRPGGSFDPDPSEGWSMPLGSLGGIRFFISYAVFVALAVLGGLVAMVQNRPGNGDLPAVTLLAVAIWMTGWMVQLIVQLTLHLGTSAKSESITIGLLGIELANPLYRRQTWSAIAVLASAVLTLAALFLFGLGCLCLHMVHQFADPWQWSTWAGELSDPSFGLASVTNGYLTAAWLFWIQAACQAFPLPHNLGRGATASVITLLSPHADGVLQLRLLRRTIRLISIATMVIAMATMIADADVFLPRWPILVVLSLLLWISSANRDLGDWVASIRVAQAGRSDHPFKPTTDAAASEAAAEPLTLPRTTRRGWMTGLADSVRLRHRRRRARAALDRERAEARDAFRLDQVLKIVSEQGTDGLNAEDRALLKRVSENLRRRREQEARMRSEDGS
ncbi:hypothetical protein FYK55_27420 [Roseiconus nitratireducens]|uniref:Transmembrane protein n=1 Tax=Roseiconus nitratireducens TaxID=2605748 RepID=A0A5M6CX34_9BACT|nr:hypothetical protein [Roseiconus nitratireducens]KAA5538552.1 hypothetical protein FYK55_27420 [Roseiconus nitratireducens]